MTLIGRVRAFVRVSAGHTPQFPLEEGGRGKIEDLCGNFSFVYLKSLIVIIITVLRRLPVRVYFFSQEEIGIVYSNQY